MPLTYPDTWVARVQKAEKLVRAADGKVYRAAGGRQEVPADIINGRVAAYMKAEAARRKRKLSKEDEQLCRDFVLMVANWQTGRWDAPSAAALNSPRPLNARPRTKPAAATGLRRAS